VQPGRDQIEEAVLGFVRAQFGRSLGRAPFDHESPLFSTGVIDSFGVLELIAFVERTYGVDIDLSAHALEEFDTAAKVAALVRRLQTTVT
jgi:acyl carrier protein